MAEEKSRREREQELYQSIEEELEERVRLKELEEKGNFKSRLEQISEQISEAAGEGGSALAYTGSGAGMGYLFKKLLPIPLRIPDWGAAVLGGVFGLHTWYANRKKRRLEREKEREAREEYAETRMNSIDYLL